MSHPNSPRDKKSFILQEIFEKEEEKLNLKNNSVNWKIKVADSNIKSMLVEILKLIILYTN
jgi:hypothetical protein